jgi:hypothetical protein
VRRDPARDAATAVRPTTPTRGADPVPLVGIKFPGFPVTVPTLASIEPLESAPLNTKLDQCRGFVFVRVRIQDGSDPFVGTPVSTPGAIVAVCAEAPEFLRAPPLPAGQRHPRDGSARLRDQPVPPRPDRHGDVLPPVGQR